MVEVWTWPESWVFAILMSGFAAFDDAVEALRLGCVDFLTKPVAMQVLQEAVMRLADRFSSWDMCMVTADEDRMCLPSGARLYPTSCAGSCIGIVPRRPINSSKKPVV